MARAPAPVQADGYTVDAAATRADALSLIDRHAYALVVSALRMPALDGPALSLALSPGDPLSLFPMAAVTGTSIGLEWPINGLAFAPDGFYRTGDICEARPGGTYAVVDRVGALARVPTGGIWPGPRIATRGTSTLRPGAPGAPPSVCSRTASQRSRRPA